MYQRATSERMPSELIQSIMQGTVQVLRILSSTRAYVPPAPGGFCRWPGCTARYAIDAEGKLLHELSCKFSDPTKMLEPERPPTKRRELMDHAPGLAPQGVGVQPPSVLALETAFLAAQSPHRGIEIRMSGAEYAATVDKRLTAEQDWVVDH
jgi:hypothetical protein